MSKKSESKGDPLFPKNIIILMNEVMDQFTALETQLKKRCKRIEDRLMKMNKRIKTLEESLNDEEG